MPIRKPKTSYKESRAKSRAIRGIVDEPDATSAAPIAPTRTAGDEPAAASAPSQPKPPSDPAGDLPVPAPQATTTVEKDRTSEDVEAAPARPKRNLRARRTTASAPDASASTSEEPQRPETETVRVRIPLPIGGLAPVFDTVLGAAGPQKGSRILLSRGIEVVIADPDADLPPSAEFYTALPKVFETTRVLPVALVDRARATYDPHRIFSGREFGEALGHALVTVYLRSLDAEPR